MFAATGSFDPSAQTDFKPSDLQLNRIEVLLTDLHWFFVGSHQDWAASQALVNYLGHPAVPSPAAPGLSLSKDTAIKPSKSKLRKQRASEVRSRMWLTSHPVDASSDSISCQAIPVAAQPTPEYFDELRMACQSTEFAYEFSQLLVTSLAEDQEKEQATAEETKGSITEPEENSTCAITSSQIPDIVDFTIEEFAANANLPANLFAAVADAVKIELTAPLSLTRFSKAQVKMLMKIIDQRCLEFVTTNKLYR